MTECLDEKAILSFGQGTMPPAQRPAVEAHIAECDECRALVSAVKRSSLIDPEELRAERVESPSPPARVDPPAALPSLEPSDAPPVKRSGGRTLAILAAVIGVLVLLGIVFNIVANRQ